MTFETSGSLITATKTADGTAVDITTDATVPTNTSISLTVKQDESGGTTADNTETISVSDGTNTTTLSNFNNVTGSSWWLTIELSTTDGTVSPTFNSATLTVEQAVTVGVDTVSLGFSVQDAFIAPEKRILRADPVSLGFTVETPQTISAETIIQPEPVRLAFDVQNALIAPFLLTDEWRVGRERVRPTAIEADAETLSLSFTVERDNIERWREYDRAGDITTETGFGGAFRALGRDGDGDTEVRPPFTRMRPFTPSTDYRVAGYAEQQVAPDRYEVTLDLQRTRNRGEAFPALSQTGAYEIGLSHGTVGLAERQVGQIDRDGAPAGAEVSLPVRVSDEQAGALLDNLGYPAGVVERSVPDGPDQRVDESGGRQTVTLSVPEEAAIDSGDWYVTDWTLSFNAYSEDRQWLVELALAR